jgi:branched-chain amino acid transport system permease protein
MLEQLLVNGITLGCIYALVAVGYTLIFGIIQVIFFAQGELSMIGAFLAIGVMQVLAPGLHPLLLVPSVLAVSVIGTAAVGVLAERTAIRPLRNAPRIKGLISSLGVSMVLQYIVFLWVGSGNFVFPQFSISQGGAFSIGGAVVKPIQVVIVILCVMTMVSLHQFMQRSRLGLAMRAVAENPRNAQLAGIDPDRTILLTFMIASSLAAVAGLAMALYYGVVKYDMGFAPGIKGFTAAILGGVGNIQGGVLGGILIGLVETLGAGYISSTYRDLLTFVILVLVLVFKPSGLLGTRLAEGR